MCIRDRVSGACGTVNATGTIIVNPAKTVSAASSSPTICINTALTAITHTTTNATNIGTWTGLPAGVTAGLASNTIIISGTPTASGTFNYSIPVTTGCGSTIYATGTIIVTPSNTITLTSATGTDAQTKNVNTAITSILYTTTGATSATVSGLPLGVNGNFNGNTATISGTPTESGTFNYTVTLQGGCTALTAQGTITVIACSPITGIIKIINTPSYSFQFSNPGKTSSALACSQTAFPVKFYASTNTLGINTQLYTDSSLTTPVTNEILWYQNQTNATSYKLDNTGKITEISTCSSSSCQSRFLNYVYVVVPHGSTVTLNYFLPNGTEINLQHTSTGGDEAKTFDVQQCIAENSITIDGNPSVTNIVWTDTNNCCPVTPVSYGFGFSNPGRSSSSLACSQTSFTNTFYAATSTLGIGTQLYTNSSLTTPVGSGNLWYKYGIEGISYRIDNTGKVADSAECLPPSTQNYSFRAVHPEEHNGTDYVIYIDLNGVQRTRTLPRSSDSNPADCIDIEAQRIVQTVGAVSCYEE